MASAKTSWASVSWNKLSQLSPAEKHRLEVKWNQAIQDARGYHDCWLHEGRTSKGYGIVWVSRDSPQKGFDCRAHIIALFLADNQGPSLDSQTSHLCHRPGCIKYSHLTFESDSDNKKRQECNNRKKCVCGLTPKCFPH